MRFEKAIRALPLIFLGLAGISVVRAILAFVGLWFIDENLARLDPMHKVALFTLVGRLIAVLLAPFTWIAWAAILALLLSIYDRISK